MSPHDDTSHHQATKRMVLPPYIFIRHESDPAHYSIRLHTGGIQLTHNFAHHRTGLATIILCLKTLL